MHRLERRWLPFALLVVLLSQIFPTALPAPARATPPVAPPQPPATSGRQPQFSQVPLAFVPNVGQTDAAVRFHAQGPGGAFYFTPHEIVLALAMPDRSPSDEHAQRTPRMGPPSVLRLRYQGANATPAISPGTQQDGVVNFLLGNDPRAWHANVATYTGITYAQLYPGIDLHYDSFGSSLKSTYLVAANTDPGVIRWRYQGATAVQVDPATGDLQIGLPSAPNSTAAQVIERAPIAWQDTHGERVPVSVRYTVAADRSVGFVLGAYDRTKALTIDPVLTYSTALGGTGSTDLGYGIAVDGAGNTYVTGYTYSPTFPTLNPAQGTLAGSADAFVTKFNASGTRLIYSTYLGGDGEDTSHAIKVSSGGRVAIVGETESTNFPVLNAYDTSYGGNCGNMTTPCDDVFVTEFNSTGNTLRYSTYLGDALDEAGLGLARDTGGNLYVTGWTTSSAFPTKNAYQSAKRGDTCSTPPCEEAFVAKLNPGAIGSDSLLYSSYLSGSTRDKGEDIVVDSAGHAYVTGYSQSTDFPTLTPYQASPAGDKDVFVAKLNPGAIGSASLLYSTFLGGTGTDRGVGIDLVGTNQVAVTGYTRSTNFPLVNAAQSSSGGGTCGADPCADALIALLNLSSNTLVYSSYLGGSGEDIGEAVAVDGSGTVYVTGSTTSDNFPIVVPLQATKGANGCGASSCSDGFITVVKPSSGPPMYSSYLGGSGVDVGYDIAVDTTGHFFVTGSTTAGDFVTTPGSFDTTISGTNDDAFAVKFTDAEIPSTPLNLRHTSLTDTSISLAWDSATDNFGVTGYVIYNGTTPLATVSGVSTVLTGLVAGTSYELTVRARDAAGNQSLVENTLSLTTPDTQAPAAPANLRLTARTDTSLALAWDAAADNGRIVAYQVFAGATQIATTPNTMYTVTGLTAGASYSYSIKALDGGANLSPASGTLTVTTNTLPTTAITSPASGATITGATTITANASDAAGITLVEFYVDGVHLADDTSAPYSVAWNTLDATLPAYDGSHALTTKAYDTDGQLTTSTSVSISVANTVGTMYRGTITGTAAPPSLTANAVTPMEVGMVVTVTNTSALTWSKNAVALRYRWISSDAQPIISDTAPISLTADLLPGASRAITVIENPPTLPSGVDRATYRLQIDLYNSATNTWFASKGNPPLDNPVIINKNLKAEALGLEKYYHYTGQDIGGGMQHLFNIANGNSLLRWTPFQAPGRGLATVVDLTYNSLEKKSESPIGSNFSLSISGLTRFGMPLDIHPNQADQIKGNANRWIAFTDGDGTTHRFDGAVAADGTVYWQEPAGVNLYLRSYSTTDPTRAWALTRPDRVTFFFDSDGYPTSVEDANGNRISFTLETTPPGQDPGGPKKRIIAVTDAAGQGTSPAPNRSFQISYYSKSEVKKGQLRGKIQRITDHSGSALDFEYYEDGNLLRIIQRGGTKADGTTLADRSFVFTYTTANNDGPAIPLAANRVDPNPKTPNQSTGLYSVRDPRGQETLFAYCNTPPGTTCDPDASQNQNKLRTLTDRAGVLTTYAYDIVNRITTVTAPLSRISKYAYDPDGKVTTITNPLNQVTGVQWSADRKVTRVTEPTGQYIEFAYNSNGYLTDRWDQLRNRTSVVYQNIAVDANDVSGKWAAGHTIPHISQPLSKTTPKGTATTAPTDDYQWSFTYDTKGNLLTVADPVQRAQAKTTTYVYNSNGTVQSVTDANGKRTTYPAYDANGLATTITDAKSQTTKLGYDDDGLLRWVQDPIHAAYTTGDPRGFRSYFDYDSFHRLGRQSAPKSTSSALGTLIWSGADYDANDNLILQIGPHYGTSYADQGGGARTTMAYDLMDRPTLTTGPDTTVDPAGERTSHTYDDAGRLTSTTLPKGMLTPLIANDFTQFVSYDPLDRVVKQYTHDVNSNGTITASQYTHQCYNLGGDLIAVTAPKANLSSVNCAAVPSYTTTIEYDTAHKPVAQVDPLSNRQSTAYDANSNVISQTNAHGHTTTIDYDQRDQVVKITQPLVTEPGLPYTMPSKNYTGTRPRTISTARSYDPVGNLLTSVSPRGWDASSDKVTFNDYVTRYTYDAVNQPVLVELPNDSAERSANKRQYVHRSYDANGQLLWSSLPVATSSAASVTADTKTTQEYWDPGWVRSSKNGTTPKTSFDYTAEGWQSTRTPGKAGDVPDATKQILWTYFADGQLREQKVQNDPQSGATSYTYDANNNLTAIRGTAGVGGKNSTETPMTIENSYDGLDRMIKTRQKKDQDSVWRFSTSTYDLNNNITDRTDDAEEGSTDPAKQGHKQHFTLDLGDRVTEQLDYGTKPDTSDDQRLTYAYLPAGWEQQRVVAKSNGANGWTTTQTVEREYYATGQPSTQTTKDANGSVTESHTVSYIDALNRYLDGNIAQDTTMLKGPAGLPTACESSCTAQYTYDPRGRMTQYQNGFGGITNYTLDPSGNITQEVDSVFGTRSFTYSGMQQSSMTFNGTTLYMFYDQDGNLDCTATTTPVTCPQTPGLSGSLRSDYTYDYQGQLTSYRGAATSLQGSSTADYTYDAVGRLMGESESHGAFGASPASARTTQFSYEGLSERISSEQATGSLGEPIGTKGYSYDAFGNPASMSNTPQGGPTAQYGYGYDTRGNISQLLHASGGAKAAYGYTPYGAAVDGTSKGDTNTTDPLNANRFMAQRFDSGSGNIQMGARQFGPGNERFLQPDRYRGALADLGLSQDPLTQNRMALAGSNPINFIEQDGHFAQALIGGLIGGVVDLGTQLLQNGGDLDEVSWGQVGISAAAGALSGGLSSVIGGAGLSTAGRIAASAAGNAAINAGATALTNVAAGRDVGDGVASSALVGGITGGLTEGISALSQHGSAAADSMCSFSADTPVATETGAVAIGELALGDHVLAYDEAAATTGIYPVTAVLVHLDQVIVHLTLDDEQIETTPEHPFFTAEHGWTTAAALQRGEYVRQRDGSVGTVMAIQTAHRPQVMYNLTVATAHTFFVGEGEWLVHNTCNLGKYKDLPPDSHHIINDAAARDLPGYSRRQAPAIELDGPSTLRGTEHYRATRMQNKKRWAGPQTYATERKIAYRSLRYAGKTIDEAKAAVRYADKYFMDELGFNPATIMRSVGSRRETW